VRDLAVAMVFIIPLVVCGGALIYFHGKRHNAWADQCEAAGGIPYTARGGRICLNPESVIRL
jgi:hypothetical protein